MDNYLEIGEQIFNLVDNEKDKINSFYDAYSTEDEKASIQNWFDENVKQNELQDLYKVGQNNDGLMNWLVSDKGRSYFLDTPIEYDETNIRNEYPSVYNNITPSKEKIKDDIEKEDEEIMSDEQIIIKQDMSDGEYQSDEVDNDDEIQLALDALENSEDDDVNIIFDIIDGSDDYYEEEGEEITDTEAGSEDDGSEEYEEIIHKKRIHLDHHVNKVVEKIDDEEEADRFAHKKYYVMKKAELGDLEHMNKLEDELDKENISYYDFGKDNTIAIKIYSQNEVRLNRIFESLGFESRCVDIAHYTDDWYSVS